MANYVNVPRGAVQSLSFFWSVGLLEWLPGEQPSTTGGGGGGGAVTVANGADATQGNISDAAWVSGNGTVVSLLKKIATPDVVQTAEVGYTTNLDFLSGSNPIYIGSAIPGSATSSAVWQIRKLTYDGSSNLTNIQYAAGTTGFTSIWDNRAVLSYS